nr:unnamed protein product [Spirometra erinaceieuropaei]
MANQETQSFEDEVALVRCLDELINLRMTGEPTDMMMELQDEANQETQSFEDEVTLVRCLPELNNLRMTGELTETVIELQDEANQETQSFEDEVTLVRCLPELNNLRMTGELTDMIIELQDEVSLHVHRVARPLIDYVYTGQLEVNEANATGLIVLSQQLVMPQVEEWAVSFMAARFNAENIKKYWDLAQLLKSEQLMNACFQHIKTNFEATVASDLFIELPADAVLSILSADDLIVESEEIVFKSIGLWELQWRECAPLSTGRLEHAAVVVPVGQEKVICVFGGENSQYQCLDTCEVYSPHEDKWYKLPGLKEKRQNSTAVALPDGRVFVIGGQCSGKSLSTVEMCHLREPADWRGPGKSSDSFWKAAAPMIYANNPRTAVAFKGGIFVAWIINSMYHSSVRVDVFVPPDNRRPLGQWTFLTNSTLNESFVALAVHQDRLFRFRYGDKQGVSVTEFVPPSSRSMSSRKKFDFWTWSDPRKIDSLKRIKRAFTLC